MHRRVYKHYSVYNRKTDMPVVIHGTASECCDVLNVTFATFYHYVHRCKTGKWYCKYEIYVDEEDE